MNPITLAHLVHLAQSSFRGFIDLVVIQQEKGHTSFHDRSWSKKTLEVHDSTPNPHAFLHRFGTRRALVKRKATGWCCWYCCGRPAIATPRERPTCFLPRRGRNPRGSSNQRHNVDSCPSQNRVATRVEGATRYSRGRTVPARALPSSRRKIGQWRRRLQHCPTLPSFLVVWWCVYFK